MLNFEVDLLYTLCRGRSTPLSQKVKKLCILKDYEALLDLKVDPSSYAMEQYDDFAHDYLISSFLKKSTNIPVTVDLYADAVKNFFEVEKRCRQSAHKLLSDPTNDDFLNRVGRLVARILGPLNEEKLKDIGNAMSFGPGSSLFDSITGKRPSSKYDAAVRCSSNLSPFLKSVMGEKWFFHHYGEMNYFEYYQLLESQKRDSLKVKCKSESMICDYNKFTTVPKTAKKDRPICVEPSMNVFVQKGIGSIIRQRLKRIVNVDLDDGQQENAAAAKRAVYDRLATIDLSNASDSVSYLLVERIFGCTEIGQKWFRLLCMCRSSHSLIMNKKDEPINYSERNYKVVKLNKFSNMGNGYTFELESLLFYCIARCSYGETKFNADDLLVYGDDIICPQLVVKDVINNLELCGFSVNSDKSFTSGLFFESCGHDYFAGKYCRPVFARMPSDEIAVPYQIKLANAIRLYSFQTSDSGFCRVMYRKAYAFCLRSSKIDDKFPRVPSELGDVGLIVPFNNRNSSYRSFDSMLGYYYWEGGMVRTLSVKLEDAQSRKESFLLLKLHSAGNTETASYGRETVLRSNRRTKLIDVTVPYWDNRLLWEDDKSLSNVINS